MDLAGVNDRKAEPSTKRVVTKLGPSRWRDSRIKQSCPKTELGANFLRDSEESETVPRQSLERVVL